MFDWLGILPIPIKGPNSWSFAVPFMCLVSPHSPITPHHPSNQWTVAERKDQDSAPCYLRSVSCLVHRLDPVGSLGTTARHRGTWASADRALPITQTSRSGSWSRRTPAVAPVAADGGWWRRWVICCLTRLWANRKGLWVFGSKNTYGNRTYRILMLRSGYCRSLPPNLPVGTGRWPESFCWLEHPFKGNEGLCRNFRHLQTISRGNLDILQWFHNGWHNTKEKWGSHRVTINKHLFGIVPSTLKPLYLPGSLSSLLFQTCLCSFGVRPHAGHRLGVAQPRLRRWAQM